MADQAPNAHDGEQDHQQDREQARAFAAAFRRFLDWIHRPPPARSNEVSALVRGFLEA